ncbi:MAG: hypothetical protein LBK99_16455 [Opitutaceae bacterium]|jgi:hypothetical protein|nr:hypothetical protein [Opitutaceae bacterium]
MTILLYFVLGLAAFLLTSIVLLVFAFMWCWFIARWKLSYDRRRARFAGRVDTPKPA